MSKEAGGGDAGASSGNKWIADAEKNMHELLAVRPASA